MKKALFFACMLALYSASGADKTPPLVVHEWGTFTSLQDEQGNAIGGINTDDEPVPPFVHRLASVFLIKKSELPPLLLKGIPACHPDVTMRLETPVLYFYPPHGARPGPFDVKVTFRGGWLTEFFPDAISSAPGFDGNSPNTSWSNALSRGAGPIGHLSRDRDGTLAWYKLSLGLHKPAPETTDKVWLAPRAVKATDVSTPAGGSEKFLFYRGVANADATLKIIRNATDKTLEVHDNHLALDMRNAEEGLRIHAAWLVDVKPDGSCAFKSVGSFPWSASSDLRATLPDSFAAGDYAAENMGRLRDEIHDALVKEGLFDDEADALLNTWEVSYFKSPGLRFFYLCPRSDIDAALPLKISVPSEITRVMIGRIEIVTPEQRAILAKIATGPAPDFTAFRAVIGTGTAGFFADPDNVKNWNAVNEGEKPISALGIPVPELYHDYLSLGRFRNALVLDEQKHRPTAALNQFILQNGLGAYEIKPPAVAAKNTTAAK